MKNKKRPVVLMILDGFGLGEDTPDNAIKAAATPNIDKLLEEWPTTSIASSGLSVGLPDGQMGNSEVGHTNIGAGRVIYQELTRISKSIADGDFFDNEALCRASRNAKGKTLHIMGLLSDGGVHSHNTHIYALVELAKRAGAEDVAVHAFLDGRDTPPDSAAGYLEELEEKLGETGCGYVATVTGRYYAMDRDKRWDRVEKAYRALVCAEGEVFTDSAKAVRKSYAAGVTDEFVLPLVREGYAGVKNGDAVVFANFRPDRARELTRAFVDERFDGFDRERLSLSQFVCMTCYDEQIESVEVAFKPERPTETLGEVLEKNGLTQLRIAETEKYAHVTFFFNGGVEEPFSGEARALIPSPKVATYDLKPEMSAPEVTERMLEELAHEKHDVIILNFANCDMVGHTGVFEAAKKAVEAVDDGVGKICSKVLDMGGAVFLTADHGNAETMLDEDGSPMTAHTTNPVVFAAIGIDTPLRAGGALCDIAPTVLDVLGIAKPAVMTGESLFVG